MALTLTKAIEEINVRKVVMNIWGESATGRTRLALTAPGPILYLSANEKSEGLTHAQVANGKDIDIACFGFCATGSPEQIQVKSEQLRDDLIETYMGGIGKYRTIIVDTESELWSLLRYAAFGALKPSAGLPMSNYSPLNGRMRMLLNAAQDDSNTHTNVIFISMATDEYEPVKGKLDRKTGRIIRSGWKHIGYKTDVWLQTTRTLDETTGKPSYSALIEKGWWNDGHVVGMSLPGELADFNNIMTLVTGLDVWGE